MKNYDKLNSELRSKIKAVMEGGDNDSVANAMSELATHMEQKILKEARSELRALNNDMTVLTQRGQAQLTQEERSYYEAVQEKRGFEGLDQALPQSIFDRVFDDLATNHPLLSKINFVNTTAVTKWIVGKPGTRKAAWGKLTSEIVKELDASFEEKSTTLCKVSAFLPVSKDMLQLGPVWLDKYVRAILSEAIAAALEEGIINGTGKDMPIGMIKDLDGSVVGRVYPDKTPKPLKDLAPQTLGTEIMAPLTREGARTVSNVLMIVNPLDYWSKIFGQTTKLNAQGVYMYDVLAIPGDVVQSSEMPVGKMACGVADDYFCGIGSSEKIEYSDDARFLEDERVYLTKQHAIGEPKDNKSFLVFDISKLGEAQELNVRKSTEKKVDEKADEKDNDK